MRIVRIITGILFLANIALFGYVSDVLIHVRPHAPISGFEVPFEAHGGITYISHTDDFLYRGSILLGVLLFLTGVVLSYLEHRRGRKGSE
jgi:hypothetical protein